MSAVWALWIAERRNAINECVSQSRGLSKEYRRVKALDNVNININVCVWGGGG
jgi:hypothetical protein